MCYNEQIHCTEAEWKTRKKFMQKQSVHTETQVSANKVTLQKPVSNDSGVNSFNSVHEELKQKPGAVKTEIMLLPI